MRLDRRHLTAWIALYAMLLISIAPLVSQTVTLAQQMPGRFEPSAMAHDHPPAHRSSTPHYAEAQHRDSPAPPAQAPHAAKDHAKCGYCHLLQLPSLPPSPPSLNKLGSLDRQLLTARPDRGYPGSARSIHAPPRAPPAAARAA